MTLGGGGGRGKQRSTASRLAPRQLAGERLVAGFSGPNPPAALQRMIRAGELAGVVLFSDNFSDAGAARRLAQRLQSIRRPRHLREPLLVMVDQEGGEIRRLPGAPQLSAAQMGSRSPAFVRRQGILTARTLARAGSNVDLAPVLDVARPGGVIGEEQRSFGSAPGGVAATGGAFGAGLQEGGIAATAKHFPGLGAAAVNTDFGPERIGLPKSTLRRVDEAPFRSFAAGGGKLVMLSTAVYPAFSDRPAVLARKIATGELRDRVGFDGVTVSDDLQSAAARAFGDPGEVARAGAAAGTDLLLFRHYGAAAEAGVALRAALRRRGLDRGEFERSAQRVLDLRAGLRG